MIEGCQWKTSWPKGSSKKKTDALCLRLEKAKEVELSMRFESQKVEVLMKVN